MKTLDYTTVTVATEGKGFAILLDGKIAKTPANKPLIVSRETLAEKIAQEWQLRADSENKNSDMHFTSLAALAIDVIAVQRDKVEQELLNYGETDQLLYREDKETELMAEQQANLDPWIKWAKEAFGTEYNLAGGIMPIAQPTENKEKYKGALSAYDHWQLAALVTVTKTTCSLILGLAVLENKLDATEALSLSRIEEEFQTRKWGADAETQSHLDAKSQEIRIAGEWIELLQR